MHEELKPKGWGSRERVAMVAEVLRQKRMVACIVHEIVSAFGECPPDRHAGEVCKEQAGCEACWARWAEQAVAEEISPKG